jgi:hypothetical protein
MRQMTSNSMIIKMDDFNEKTAGKAVFFIRRIPKKWYKSIEI